MGTLIVEDCSIVRARAIDPLTSGTLGPVSAYVDIAVQFEAWEPTEIAVCDSAGVRGGDGGEEIVYTERIQPADSTGREGGADS